MDTPDKKRLKKHFIEIPNDISKMSDAQIETWAKKAYDQLIPVLKAKGSKEETGESINLVEIDSKESAPSSNAE